MSMSLHDRAIELLRLIEDIDREARLHKQHFDACKAKCFEELRWIDEALVKETEKKRRMEK